jgi:hypothetical protein
MLLDEKVLADKLTGAIGTGLGDLFWAMVAQFFKSRSLACLLRVISPTFGSARALLLKVRDLLATR